MEIHTAHAEKSAMTKELPACLVDFQQLLAVPCPCGQAKRAFADWPTSPVSVHEVDIQQEAQLHYHRYHTEIYYILNCAPDAAIELDGQRYPVQPGMAVYIAPGVRHRALGTMKILNIVAPPFDPADEWFDNDIEPSSSK